MKMKLDSVSLADGAIGELFDHQLKKVLANIADPSTNPESARKITIEVTLTPDESRSMLGISIASNCTLAHIRPVKAAAMLESKDGNLVAVINKAEEEELPGHVLAFERNA